jgi:hypothetical protein
MENMHQQSSEDVGHEASDELCYDGSLAHSTWSFCCTIDNIEAA